MLQVPEQLPLANCQVQTVLWEQVVVAAKTASSALVAAAIVPGKSWLVLVPEKIAALSSAAMEQKPLLAEVQGLVPDLPSRPLPSPVSGQNSVGTDCWERRPAICLSC